MNRRLWLLARVVLHPGYRGAGLAAAFIRASCRTCPVPWIETLSALGRFHPVFERAGFRRVGVVERSGKSGTRYPRIHGRGQRIAAETARKSRQAEPVYYIWEQEKGSKRRRPPPAPDSS